MEPLPTCLEALLEASATKPAAVTLLKELPEHRGAPGNSNEFPTVVCLLMRCGHQRVVQFCGANVVTPHTETDNSVKCFYGLTETALPDIPPDGELPPDDLPPPLLPLAG